MKLKVITSVGNRELTEKLRGAEVEVEACSPHYVHYDNLLLTWICSLKSSSFISFPVRESFAHSSALGS